VGKSVSIVVPSYQGENRLPLLLQALENQQTDCDWEVIVVLDGSTDGSEAILAEWAEKIPLKYSARKQNLGRSATLNEGFKLATKDVLVRCDDDLVPDSKYIQIYSQTITENPKTGAVGLPNNVFKNTKYSKVYGEPVDKRYAREAYASNQEDRWHYWGGNCGVSREAFQEVGEYDTNFREYGWEDVDWGYRLSKLGYGIALVPGLEVPHNAASTTTATRCERARWSGSASVRFEKKHGVVKVEPQKTLWNTLVKILSRIAGKELGRFVDLLLWIVPARVGLRLADMTIQASHRRGVSDARSSLLSK
jgi:GT2 family glycosyltransferase